jgi:hypothetical protein
MGGGGGAGTAGVLDALKDMEDRIKDFCNDTFALKTDLNGLGGATEPTLGENDAGGALKQMMGP